MCDFNNEHARQLGRIEQKLDDLAPVVASHTKRLSSLERWRAWTMGGAAVLIAGITAKLRNPNL